MKMLFSYSTGGVYLEEVHKDIPEDAVMLSVDEIAKARLALVKASATQQETEGQEKTNG